MKIRWHEHLQAESRNRPGLLRSQRSLFLPSPPYNPDTGHIQFWCSSNSTNQKARGGIRLHFLRASLLSQASPTHPFFIASFHPLLGCTLKGCWQWGPARKSIIVDGHCNGCELIHLKNKMKIMMAMQESWKKLYFQCNYNFNNRKLCCSVFGFIEQIARLSAGHREIGMKQYKGRRVYRTKPLKGQCLK